MHPGRGDLNDDLINRLVLAKDQPSRSFTLALAWPKPVSKSTSATVGLLIPVAGLCASY
jgi:hypothetical protein